MELSKADQIDDADESANSKLQLTNTSGTVNKNTSGNAAPVTSSTNQNDVSTMATLAENGYYKEWILECIDKLRDRKARPDVDRISVLMKRLHNVSPMETQRCLDKLADMGQVICVDYKGNVSYRNPRKWRKCGSSCVLNPPSIGKVLLDVALNLTNVKKASQSTDLSFNALEIENALQGKISFMGNRLEIILDRECAYGCLTRRSDGRYQLDDAREKKRCQGNFTKKPPRPPMSISHAKQNVLMKNNLNKTTSPSTPVIHVSIPTALTVVSSASTTQTISTITSNGNTIDLSSSHPYSYQPGASRPFLLPAPPNATTTVCTTSSTPTSGTSGTSSVSAIETASSMVPQQQLHHMNRKAANFGHRRGRPPAIQPKRPHTNISQSNGDSYAPVNGGVPESMQSDFGGRGKIPRISLSSMSVSSQSTLLSGGACDTVLYSAPSLANAPDCHRPDSSSSNKISQQSLLLEVRCSECKEGSSAEKKIYSCSTCRIRAHLGCLGFWVSEPMEPATWQCPKCIVCRICRKRDSVDRLLVCATCTRAYHSQCHEPHVDDNIEIFQPWVCEPCDSQGFYFIPHGHDTHCGANTTPTGEDGFTTITTPHDINPSLLTSAVVDKALAESTTYLTSGDVDVNEEKVHHNALVMTTNVKVISNEADSMPSLSREEDYCNNTPVVSTSMQRSTRAAQAAPGSSNSPPSQNMSPNADTVKPQASSNKNSSGSQGKCIDLKDLKTNVNHNVTSTANAGVDIGLLTETMVNAWTVQDVVSWLDNQGYARESKLFLEQEIDGPSLLLMRQMDLLTQLGLKLGPAVKILQLLKKIQIDEQT